MTDKPLVCPMPDAFAMYASSSSLVINWTYGFSSSIEGTEIGPLTNYSRTLFDRLRPVDDVEDFMLFRKDSDFSLVKALNSLGIFESSIVLGSAFGVAEKCLLK
jgi:hypothetical protein